MKTILKKLPYILMIIINIILIINYKNSPLMQSREIKVEIKGAVEKPGVYKIKENTRVEDLVKLAKMNKYATTEFNNLSKKLKDEDVVIIYTKEETNDFIEGKGTIKYIEKECVCPKVNNISCYYDAITSLDGIINKTGKISLNSATIEELDLLPGIGESRALDIIKYREENNGFKDIEEIMNVKGIGESTFEKLKNYLTL